MSTRDWCVHVLAPAGEYSTDELTACCGQVFSTEVIHDQPPPGTVCEPCRLMFLDSFTAGSSSRTSVPSD
ncbi:MAG: hypothetical protein ACRDRO_05060 [Pseudonocardiaceae bacterium]